MLPHERTAGRPADDVGHSTFSIKTRSSVRSYTLLSVKGSSPMRFSKLLRLLLLTMAASPVMWGQNPPGFSPPMVRIPWNNYTVSRIPNSYQTIIGQSGTYVIPGTSGVRGGGRRPEPTPRGRSATVRAGMGVGTNIGSGRRSRKGASARHALAAVARGRRDDYLSARIPDFFCSARSFRACAPGSPPGGG